MRDYGRNDRSGGRRYGGGDFRGRDSGRREMHRAICDECGESCEVPFRPSGDKPIYCSDCFERRNDGGSNRSDRRSSGSSSYGRKDDSNRQLLDQLSSLNTKLDRILNVLESGGEKKEKVEIKKTEKKEVKKEVKPKEVKKEIKKVVNIAIPKDEKVKVKKASKKEAETSSPKE